MDTNSVGPPSKKTERNIAAAKARSLWLGSVHLEWTLRTGQFRFLPAWSVMSTELWNEGPVRWFRGYWLTGGISVYWALPERRGQHRESWAVPIGEREEWSQSRRERRLYPHGTHQI